MKIIPLCGCNYAKKQHYGECLSLVQFCVISFTNIFLGLTVKSQPSFIKDLLQVLFSPRHFFAQRFCAVSSQRLFALSFVGIFFGVLVGNLLTMFFAHVVLQDFARDQSAYLVALDAFGLKANNFTELVEAQFAYSVLLACLSPIIAYVAPHLFGGALFIFMWLIYRPNNQFDFHRVMECAAIALTSMAFYMVPGIGPLIALVAMGTNASRALTVHYKLTGFFKGMSIIFAMYLCFFLTSSTFQLLAVPVGHWLK